MQFWRFKYVFLPLHLVERATSNAGVSFSTFFLMPSGCYFREQSSTERTMWFVFCGSTLKMNRKTEVAAKVLTRFLKMLAWYYLNHWLKLRVGDAVEEAHISHFHILIASIFILLFSCKTWRKLAFCHDPLSVQCLTVGIILCVRWVVLTFRKEMAIWINRPAFHKHTTETSEDLCCKRCEIYTWDRKRILWKNKTLVVCLRSRDMLYFVRLSLQQWETVLILKLFIKGDIINWFFKENLKYIHSFNVCFVCMFVLSFSTSCLNLLI